VSNKDDEVDLLRSVTQQNAQSILWQGNAPNRSRARLAAIVESSEDAIISKTLDGRILSGMQAPSGFLATRHTRQSVSLFRSLFLWTARDEERLILERLRRGERIEHYETVRRSKQGRQLDISLTISPIRDGTGRLIAASKIARDITARKQASKEHDSCRRKCRPDRID